VSGPSHRFGCAAAAGSAAAARKALRLLEKRCGCSKSAAAAQKALRLLKKRSAKKANFRY